MTWLTPDRRKALYSLGVAALGCLTVYGVVTADKATAIIGLFGALLNTLATLKTDTSTVSGMPAEEMTDANSRNV